MVDIALKSKPSVGFKFVSVMALGLIAGVIGASGGAEAQMNNKPFSFKTTGPSGLGMSAAGKQAILDLKLSGVTPKNLLRDSSSGRLLIGPVKGRAGTAIVASPDGAVLPGYKTRDFRSGRTGIGVGFFNAYFVPRAGGGVTTVYSTYTATTPGLVNTWTSRVISGNGGVFYGAPTAVTIWTGQVSGMGDTRK